MAHALTLSNISKRYGTTEAVRAIDLVIQQGKTTVLIGPKASTESVILAEIATHLAGNEGLEAEHCQGLGGTRLLWEALLAGQIDVYRNTPVR